MSKQLLFDSIVADPEKKVFRQPPSSRAELIWLRDYCASLADMYKTEEEFHAAVASASCPHVPYVVTPVESIQGFVYLMRNRRNGLTKIGFSKDPKYRESTLQSEEPEVALLSAWRGTRATEEELHEQFSKARVRGEWFELDDVDCALIEGRMTGTGGF